MRRRVSTGAAMSESAMIRRAFLAGLVASVPWIIAAFGWAAHWNAYINLAATFGGVVLILTGLASTNDRWPAARLDGSSE